MGELKKSRFLMSFLIYSIRVKKMKYEIVATDEIISNDTGLVLVNNIINLTSFKEKINNKNHLRVQSKDISNRDIFMTYMGILSQGRTEFERVDEYRSNEYFRQALEIEKSPSCSILRQRFNAIGDIESNLKDVKKIIDETNVEILQTQNVELTPCYQNYVPLDIDVTPMDNSGSKKEGVSYTYKKVEGFAPIMAYIGTEGYLMRCELREGKAHGQCAKTVPFLKETIDLAKEVTKEPILVRTDCAHDCSDNVLLFTEKQVDFLIKKRNIAADKPEFYFGQAEEKGRKKETREGKERYLYSYEKIYVCKREDGTSENIEVRVVVDAIRRTSKPDGQILLIPEYECKRYVTSLRELTEEEIIELYHNHATSEQFHSEIKTDMDIERLPSGKFSTNEIVLGLGGMVYNILRLIGQMNCKLETSPKRAIERKRIKSVIKDMIMLASKLVNHARKKLIKIYKEEVQINVFREIYELTYG